MCPQLPLSTPPVLSQPPETALMFTLRCAELRRPRGLGPGCNPLAGNSVFMCFFPEMECEIRAGGRNGKASYHGVEGSGGLYGR